MGGHDLSALLAGAGGGSLLDLLPLQGGGGGGGGEGGGAEGGDGQLWRRKGPSFWTAEEKAAFMEVRVHAPSACLRGPLCPHTSPPPDVMQVCLFPLSCKNMTPLLHRPSLPPLPPPLSCRCTWCMAGTGAGSQMQYRPSPSHRSRPTTRTTR